MKIGILGGSFDPIHKGHMYMALSALKDCSLDRVWLIPAGHSPNKDEKKMTSAEDRLAMCRIAAEPYPEIIASDFETSINATSYTYLTIEKLDKLYPDNRFYFIMGGDSLDYFEKWRHPEIIAAHAVILVVVREGFDRNSMEKKIEEIKKLFPCDIRLIPCEPFDLSSTMIRNHINDSEFCRSMLPEGVYDYITEKKLYQ